MGFRIWKTTLNLAGKALMRPKIGQLEKIAQLKGITVEKLRNLKELDLDHMFFDTSPLKQLRNLEKLTLFSGGISDFNFLKELSNLKELNFVHTNVYNPKPLKRLKNLEILDFSHSEVSDITPLKELYNLKELYLCGAAHQIGTFYLPDGTPVKKVISDISPLQGLGNLRKLSLRSTGVSNIVPLKRLTNLIELDLGNTPISDISSLNALKSLKELDLGGTNVSDISPLRELQNLEMLFLWGTNISTSAIPVLKDLKSLKTLVLSFTPLCDSGLPFSFFSDLKHVKMGLSGKGTKDPWWIAGREMEKMELADKSVTAVSCAIAINQSFSEISRDFELWR
jgi:hypothetical protein